MGKIITNIGKGAYNTYKYAAESAGKIAREISLKAQMASNRSQIKELYEDIGKDVYEKYLLKEKIDIDSDFATDCSMIDILAGEIEEMRMEVLSLKELKQCPKCNYEIGLDYHYCPNCGQEQDLTEEDMKNDGPATIETTDNIDKTLKAKINKISNEPKNLSEQKNSNEHRNLTEQKNSNNHRNLNEQENSESTTSKKSENEYKNKNDGKYENKRDGNLENKYENNNYEETQEDDE